MVSQQIINEIREKLIKKISPQKIILFGSYAYGVADEDSDLDLYIVTDDDFMPQSYKEKSKIYLNTVNIIDEFYKQISIDVIVHTKPMYDKFVELNSMFSRQILQDGVKLYEKND